jgi:DNA-nicking Smr family endonuclease
MTRRPISTDERALWDSVAKSAKPLRRPRAAKPPITIAEKPAAKPLAAAPVIAPPVIVLPAAPKQLRVTAIERRERTRLKRGHRDIDARIDLHGMTQARAHRALLAFLRAASDDGARYVLVITGKGRSGAVDERGVLRRVVPEWLELADFRALVSGYDEAAHGHGGEGALYIRLRRG